MEPHIVVFVRHGQAEPQRSLATDMTRRLTGMGKRLLENAYPEPFSSLPGDITLYASDAVRTRQTAEVISGILNVPVKASHALTVQNTDAIVELTRESEGITILVGHNPSIEDAASRVSGRMRSMVRGEALALDLSGRRPAVIFDCRPR